MRKYYRTTSQDWLINLLTDKSIKTKDKQFISLSLDEYSGSQDNYGDVRITFNADILNEQGAIEVDYDDMDFFEQFPDITRHITGFSSEQEYYDNSGYANREEANADAELGWEDNIESYKPEEEVVIEEIVLEDNLILNVEFLNDTEPNMKLEDLLKSKNIKYIINVIKENLSMLPEVIDYKGYTINLKKSERFKDSYMCSVYLNDEYKMGLRGSCDYNDGKEAAIIFIDGQIKNTIKENMKLIGEYQGKPHEVEMSETDLKDYFKKSKNESDFIKKITLAITDETDTIPSETKRLLYKWYNNYLYKTKNIKEMKSVKVTYKNGDVITTSINGTDEEILKYFGKGKKFNLGSGDKDNITEVENAEIINENNSIEDGFSIKHISREDVNTMIDILDDNDIAYDLDGPNEILNFDITELDKYNQQYFNKLLKINEALYIDKMYVNKSISKFNKTFLTTEPTYEDFIKLSVEILKHLDEENDVNIEVLTDHLGISWNDEKLETDANDILGVLNLLKPTNEAIEKVTDKATRIISDKNPSILYNVLKEENEITIMQTIGNKTQRVHLPIDTIAELIKTIKTK